MTDEAHSELESAVDESLLDELDRRDSARRRFEGGHMGHDESLSASPLDRLAENVGTPTPLALNLRKLYDLQGAKLPPHLEAMLGAHDSFLLAFEFGMKAPDNGPPPTVSCFSFDITHESKSAKVVSFAPKTAKVEKGKLGVSSSFGVQLGGEIDGVEIAKKTPIAVPGFSMSSAKLHGALDVGYSIAVSWTLSELATHAVKHSDSLCQFQFYRSTDELLAPITVLQTVLVPPHVSEIDLTIRPTITLPKRWLGILPARTFSDKPRRRTVDLASLR